MSKNRPKLESVLHPFNPKEKSSRFIDIPIDSIIVLGQPRKTFDRINELAKSIEVVGLLQPIVVTKGKTEGDFVLVSGERRLRAFKWLNERHPDKHNKIKAYVKNEELDDEKVLLTQLIENLQREDLTPLEEAESLNIILKEHNMTQLELSNMIGKERSTVSKTLKLVDYPSELYKKICELTHNPSKFLLGKALEHFKTGNIDDFLKFLGNELTDKKVKEYDKEKNKKKKVKWYNLDSFEGKYKRNTKGNNVTLTFTLPKDKEQNFLDTIGIKQEKQ